jgi:hypothetical protein
MDESVQEHLKPALDDAAKLLLKAAAIMEERGLAQGEYVLGNGAVCIYGALYTAQDAVKCMRDADDHPVFREAKGRLSDNLMNGPGGMGIINWNDKLGRTKDEVVAKLRAVALGG